MGAFRCNALTPIAFGLQFRDMDACRLGVLVLLLAMPVQQASAGEHDFDGDERDDLAWRNPRNGANVLWRSADAETRVGLVTVTDPRWKIVGSGDFDGDGRADLLWRHRGTGANTIWRSGQWATQQRVARVADTDWVVWGVGDFDGDRRADILWFHPRLGGGGWPAANAALARAIPPRQLVAIGDLD